MRVPENHNLHDTEYGMSKKVVFPVTDMAQAERQLQDVATLATLLGLPVHVSWIVDISPFVRWTDHGPVLDQPSLRRVLLKRKADGFQSASTLCRKLRQLGVGSGFDVRAGCLDQELRALKLSGDVVYTRTPGVSAAKAAEVRAPQTRTELREPVDGRHGVQQPVFRPWEFTSGTEGHSPLIGTVQERGGRSEEAEA